MYEQGNLEAAVRQNLLAYLNERRAADPQAIIEANITEAVTIVSDQMKESKTPQAMSDNIKKGFAALKTWSKTL